MSRRLIPSLVSLLAVIALSPIALAQTESGKKSSTPQQGKVYWTFLVTGKSTQGVERSEITKMQSEHLANFGRLHEKGKLFAAGPLADPQKKMRGIVVVTAPDFESLPDLFDADPYVKQGFMTLDAIEMEVAVGEFRNDFDTKKLAEYRMVLLEKSTPEAAELDAAAITKNLEYCQSIRAPDRLCLAGWLRDERSSRRAILVFRKLDDSALGSLVDNLPAIASKSWKATTIPLYMSDGVVK